MFALADGLGALATFISGAGPTILSVVRTAEANVFLSARRRRWRRRAGAFYTAPLRGGQRGGKGRLNGRAGKMKKQERVCRATAFDRGIGENRYGTHRTKIRRQLRRGPRPHF
ncbi:MAG: hypothetical protein ACLSWY_01680 [Ruthenibacterium lactatiformans]